jgi:hypothetical protein
MSSRRRRYALTGMDVDTAFTMLHFVRVDNHGLHSGSLAKVLATQTKARFFFHTILPHRIVLVDEWLLTASNAATIDTFTARSEVIKILLERISGIWSFKLFSHFIWFFMFVGIIALLSFLPVPTSGLLFIHMSELFIFLTELIELLEQLTQVFLDEVLLDLCELLIELASS